MLLPFRLLFLITNDQIWTDIYNRDFMSSYYDKNLIKNTHQITLCITLLLFPKLTCMWYVLIILQKGEGDHKQVSISQRLPLFESKILLMVKCYLSNRFLKVLLLCIDFVFYTKWISTIWAPVEIYMTFVLYLTHLLIHSRDLSKAAAIKHFHDLYSYTMIMIC